MIRYDISPAEYRTYSIEYRTRYDTGCTVRTVQRDLYRYWNTCEYSDPHQYVIRQKYIVMFVRVDWMGCGLPIMNECTEYGVP